MKFATVFLVALGLSVAAIGAVFTILMWESFQRADAMHHWPRVPITILSSGIEERRHDSFSPTEYRLKILYGYEWAGERVTGDRLTSRGNPFSKQQGMIGKAVKKYSEGSEAVAYVDPANPEFSVLQPDTRAAGYSIWFPLLFVVGGLGIAVRAVLAAIRQPSTRL